MSSKRIEQNRIDIFQHVNKVLYITFFFVLLPQKYLILFNGKLVALFFHCGKKEKTYWLSSPFPINNNNN